MRRAPKHERLDWEELENAPNTRGAFSFLRAQPAVIDIGQHIRPAPVIESPLTTDDITSTVDVMVEASAEPSKSTAQGLRRRPYKIHLCRSVQDAHTSGETQLLTSLWKYGSPDGAGNRTITIGLDRMARIARMSDKAARRNMTHMLHSAASAAQTGAITNSISLMISGPSSIGTTLLLILGAVFMVGAYVVIALHYVMAMVEAYVTVGAGYIFLGFGGSRWTVPYTEKYLGMVVAAGVRIMVLELLIGLGSTLYPQWNQMALKISAIPDLIDGGTVGGQWTGVELEAALVSSIAIYGLLCWMIPRLASNVVQGGLSMSGGDVIAGGAAVASAGMAAASLMTSSSQSSSKAVADVAQAAAMTGVQMGMQAAMATASGGSSVAVTAAASGVQGIGSNATGAAVSGASVDGFTPLPPGMAGGGVNVAPPVDGPGVGQGEVAMTGLDGRANTGTPLAGPSLAEDLGSNLIAGAPSPIEQAEIATVPDETRESPQVPTSESRLGGVMNTLKTVVNEAEQAIKRMPDGGGHVGGTTPKVDHGE